jgi:cytochrome c
MKIRTSIMVMFAIAASVAWSGAALAAAAAAPKTLPEAVAAGEKLFNDPSLGTNKQTCNSCHPQMGKGDKGFVGREPFPKLFMGMKVTTLDQAIQMCITSPLKGKALKWDDPRLTELAAYVQSIYLMKK